MSEHRRSSLREAARFHAWLRDASDTEWVVYAKPPFGGPEDVLKYLARYTHRAAISSSRLLSLENGRVTFRWRDLKHGNQIKPMILDAIEFIRRFLLHILPSGFVKIRHFGFLSNHAVAVPYPSEGLLAASTSGRKSETPRRITP